MMPPPATGALSQHLLARMLSVWFTASGLIALAFVPFMEPLGLNQRGAAVLMPVISVIALVTGIGAWFAPWARWPRPAGLALIPVALLLIGAGGFYVDLFPYTYGAYYVVVFLWIGTAQPQWTSLKFLPPAAAACVLPPLLGPPGDVIEPATIIYVSAVIITISCATGEALAWITGKLRQAELVDVSRMHDIENLVGVSTKLARVSDPEHLAQLVATLSGKLLGGDMAIVSLLEADGTLAGVSSWNWSGPYEEVRLVPDDGTGVVESVTAGELRVFENVEGLGRSVLTLPIRGSGGPIGLIAVVFESKAPVLNSFIEDLGSTFATQAGLAFERVWSMQSLVDKSLRDELTGLGNRRHGAVLLSRLASGDAVIMLDLDNFKGINDFLGHAAGDGALRDISSFLKEALRDSDLVARWGGDEFLIVLRGAREQAHVTLERISSSWRNREPATTFSAGIAIHEPGYAPSDTLKQADAAMYRAKQSGRDRICSKDDLPALF